MAVALGLMAGGLSGGLADEAIKVFGMNDRQTNFNDVSHDKYSFMQCVIHLHTFQSGLVVVIYTFLVAMMLASFANKVIPGYASQPVKMSLAATVALLGLTVTGSLVGAVVDHLQTSLPVLLIFSHSLNSAILSVLLLCFKASVTVQTATLAVYTASFTPSALVCFPYPSIVLGPSVCLLYCLTLAVLHLVFYLHAVVGTASPCAHFTPSIILMLIMVISSAFSVTINENSTSTREPMDSILIITVITLLLLAVGVGASVNTQLVMKEEFENVFTVSVAGGGAILVMVQNTSSVLGTWGSFGVLMGVSGAVGVALSAAGAVAEGYGEGSEEREKNVVEMDKSEKQGDDDTVQEIRNSNLDSATDFFAWINILMMSFFYFYYFYLAAVVDWLTRVLAGVFVVAWVASIIAFMKRPRTYSSPLSGLKELLRMIGLGLKEFLTALYRAARATGRRGFLGRAAVASGSILGVILSTGSQDWRIRAFVATCAVVIPLTSLNTHKALTVHTNRHMKQFLDQQ